MDSCPAASGGEVDSPITGAVFMGDLRKNVVLGTSPFTSAGYSGSAEGEVFGDGTSSVAVDLEKKPLEPERVK